MEGEEAQVTLPNMIKTAPTSADACQWTAHICHNFTGNKCSYLKSINQQSGHCCSMRAVDHLEGIRPVNENHHSQVSRPQILCTHSQVPTLLGQASDSRSSPDVGQTLDSDV